MAEKFDLSIRRDRQVVRKEYRVLAIVTNGRLLVRMAPT